MFGHCSCCLMVMIIMAGKMGVKRVPVGVVAVFDGHNGAEASEMASRLLLEYFALHMYFLLDSTFSVMLRKSEGMLQDIKKQDIVFQVLDWNEKLGGHELNFERFLQYFICSLNSFFCLEKFFFFAFLTFYF